MIRLFFCVEKSIPLCYDVSLWGILGHTKGKGLIEMKHHIGVYIIVGLALFSMLFGSGNLIFPPDIGITGGTEWYKGYIAYFLADAGLGICSVFAMLKVDGDLNRLTGSIGPKGAMIINTVCIICIGPMLAIPRNAAVTFEMGISPLFGIDPSSRILRLVFSIIFFGIVLLLTIRPSKVVDILGKYLTPILVVAIAVLIIIGIAAPAAQAGAPTSDNLIRDGIFNGYQTLDLMAGIYFSIIIIQSIRSRKLQSKREERKTAAAAALIAGALLCFVYGGMAYLGATTGSQWQQQFTSEEINQAGLVVNITDALMGSFGVAFLSIIVSLACLTTAVGLTSAAGEYFNRIIPSRSYAFMVVIICIVSAILCNFGLSAIISIAAPILMLFYPPVMFLTLTCLGRNIFRKKNFYQFGMCICFVISLFTVLTDTFGISSLAWIHTALPLDTFGFNWVIPTAIAAAIGHFLPGPEIEV